MSHFLHLKNISFKYSGIGASPSDVLRDVSFSLGANECVAIVGRSGSGKTTLIQHFTGLLQPSSGQVLYDDADIWHKSFKKSVLRKKIGIVFQFAENQLFEETVARDIAFGPKNMGLGEADVESRINDAMQSVELDPETFRDRSPFRLSEGEKRRVAIAGVLAMQPDMLVFDEPTAGLDPKSVQRFAGIVGRLKTAGKSIVIVSHSMDFVAQVADRIIALRQGELVFDGTPRQLFADADKINSIGLERPSLLDALDSWAHPIPDDIKDVLSLEELKIKLEKSAHSTDF
jgi:energy-coupling factor transport system ATP-binding protein